MSGQEKKRIGSLEGRYRRNTRILIAAVTAVAVGVGAALLLADSGDASADRGELTFAPVPAPVTASPQVTPVPAASPMPSAAGIAATIGPLAADPALGKFTGSVADAITGTVLWSVEPKTPMTPASTTKVLTSAAALLTLPLEHRVTTKVVRGAAPGVLVLVAGGDPTITAKPVGENGYYPGSARVAGLVDQIVEAGIPVESIVVDTSIYAGPSMAQGWFPNDIGGGFIAPIEPIMIDGGRLNPLEDESPRSAAPALDAGRVLARALGIDPAKVTLGVAPPAASTVASVESAPLRDRLRQMMEHSDNVLAEAIGREVAMKVGTDASFTGAVAAIGQTLFAAGFDMDGLALHDASGLSVDDRVTASLLDQILISAAGDGNPKLRPMLDHLPVAGGTGSLSDRYASGNRTGAGWVRAKTGTLSNASSLAGFVVDESGRVLTFALMSNDRPPEVSRPALDAVAARLRTCGCL